MITEPVCSDYKLPYNWQPNVEQNIKLNAYVCVVVYLLRYFSNGFVNSGLFSVLNSFVLVHKTEYLSVCLHRYFLVTVFCEQ